MEPAELLVDPAVTRSKFDREIDLYQRIEATNHRRGCWLLSVDFPAVLVAFLQPALQPPAVLMGIRVGFENYDLWAPSVTFIDPFSREPYPTVQDLPVQMWRNVPAQLPAGLPPGLVAQQRFPLIQAFAGRLPFLCLPGIREYHSNPGHSGDSWLLHRTRGEGTLAFICDQVLRYAVEPIRGYRFAMHVAGFNAAEPPA